MHLFSYVTLLAVALYMSTGIAPVAERREENPAASKISPAFSPNFSYRASEARRFIRENGFNESVCFMVDMSIPSNRMRFFIYDLRENEVKAQAMVSHGLCQGGEPGEMFSNKVGSGCSSLGKYRIGQSYYGQWGYSYKLHGLEPTNSRAYERTVVLHAHHAIPDIEVEDEIVKSLGCPMVSPGFLASLKKIINSSSRPILLWVYR